MTHNESTHTNRTTKSVLVRILIPTGWTLLALLALAVLIALVMVSTERTGSPEVGSGFGVGLMLFLMALVALFGWLFSIAARKQSTGGLITMVILMAYPLIMLAARPIVMALKERKWERERAQVGSTAGPQPESNVAAGESEP